MQIWIDGTICDLTEARISPLDRGVTVGDGVFETLRVYDGTPFAWTRHIARLQASAEGLGLALANIDALRAAADATLRANSLQEARLRITVTGGEGPPGSSRAGAEPRTMIVAVPFTPGAESTTAVIAPWTRNEHSATAGLKTISYAANVRALAFAEARGATEAIFANTRGNVCEATGSNVFVVQGSVLVTPPATAGCLLGVTRGLVIELARSLGVRAEERDLAMDDLFRADEVFLSSTTREVQRVTRIDDTVTGPDTAATDAISRRIAVAYTELVGRDLDP